MMSVLQERQVAEWHATISAVRPHQATLPLHDEGELNGYISRGSITDFPWVENAGGFLSLQESVVKDGREFAEAFVNRSRPAVIKV